MDVRVEFLEWGFEGIINTHEDVASLKRLFEDEHIEREKLKAQMAKLMAAVSNLSSTDHGSENHDHAGCHNHDYIDRELKWQNLEIPIFDGEDVFG